MLAIDLNIADVDDHNTDQLMSTSKWLVLEFS